MNRISIILPPSIDVGTDRRLNVGNGERFSVATIYRLLDVRDNNHDEDMWKSIWHLQVSECIKHFVWPLHYDGLLMNKKKHRMHLGSAM